jgi:NCAIR mutase (PurE)-related protein
LDRDEFRKLLEEVATGRIEVGTALDRVQGHGIEELGFARLDTGREQRTGIAEVIFAPGKTADQLDVIVERCLANHGKVLVTRIETELAEPLLARFDVLRYHAIARILEARPEREAKWPSVAVVSAGTSDQPVAEEAAVVLEHLGHSVVRITDVGVAGIHRLLSVLDRLRRARALVVAAGMEGALPSPQASGWSTSTTGLVQPLWFTASRRLTAGKRTHEPSPALSRLCRRRSGRYGPVRTCRGFEECSGDRRSAAAARVRRRHPRMA